MMSKAQMADIHLGLLHALENDMECYLHTHAKANITPKLQCNHFCCTDYVYDWLSRSRAFLRAPEAFVKMTGTAGLIEWRRSQKNNTHTQGLKGLCLNSFATARSSVKGR